MNWGDGTPATSHEGDATHSYVTAGIYTVQISGTFPRIYFNNSGDRAKIKEITQWGTNRWNSMERAFYGCSNLSYTATDAPVLSNVTDMSYMFAYAAAFNGDLSSWDVRAVTDMSYMFWNAAAFNGNISSWDVSAVTNMSYMFDGAAAFNGDLSSWDVSAVTNMSSMFLDATAFNGDLSSWDVREVTNMSSMFANTAAFNGDLSSWNVGAVTDMSYMFWNAAAFNGDLSSWDVSAVTNMSYMFWNATTFNSDLSSWDVSAVTSMSGMFSGVTLPTATYDKLLDAWSKKTVQNNVDFNGGNSKYCDAGEVGKNSLAAKGWIITDGGKDTDAICASLSVTTHQNTPWQLSPNPTKAMVQLSGNSPVEKITVFSITGQKHKEVTNSRELSLSELQNGVYLIQVKNADQSHVFKVIKQ